MSREKELEAEVDALHEMVRDLQKGLATATAAEVLATRELAKACALLARWMTQHPDGMCPECIDTRAFLRRDEGGNR